MSIFSRLLSIIKYNFYSTLDNNHITEAEKEIIQFKRKPYVNVSISEAPQDIIASTENTNLISDYKLLGLLPNCTLNEIDKAWQRLAKRADPKRFIEGSEEEKRAAEILSKINAAYKRIRESKNPTEGRFGNLEL